MVIAAGCTTMSPGEAIPATTVDTSTSDLPPPTSGDGEDLPFAGAPKVEDPLDTTRFQQDPCRTLTADQTRELNLPPTGEPEKGRPLGNACVWFNPETWAEAEVHFADQDPRGLSALYNVKDRYAYFDELPPIDGYPAIAVGALDDRDIGHCTVVVGVSDEVTFDVPVKLSEANVGKKDPCEAAAGVAAMALATMKG
ncbi:DUF3558 domain-containing protein [Actinophytocola glycyrrhizae]|uniref:DUF3558 domain-containing protein n=1 Tax=Actinophytocola glycyrrhizae TaxID=2044873 RepID=A0ABV9S0H4_9PSEU